MSASPPQPPPLPGTPGDSPEPPPEEREPVVTKAPPAGKKFPCKKCGAKLDFDPSSQGLQCPYCGATEAIEVAEAGRELDFKEYLEKGGREVAPDDRWAQVPCPACGAVVVFDAKVITDRCPYCGSHLESKPELVAPLIVPESILPFQVAERQAIEAFNQWVASRWFAPNSLKRFANLGKLEGVYLPYWTYDSMTYTRYRGQRGDDYTVTETYTDRDAQGNTVTKTRQVVKTRWTSVSGEVRHFFDDVLVCGSKSLPEDLVDGLAPWRLRDLEGFKPEFLSGFRTERYAVDLAEGFDQARAIMDGEIREQCRRDIGGDHQQLESVQTKHVGVTFKHILLPVWVAAYRYRDQPYRILVNGKTGLVVGTRPYSWVKILLLVLLILALIGAAILLFWAFAGGGGGGGGEVGQTNQTSPAVCRPSREGDFREQALAAGAGPAGCFGVRARRRPERQPARQGPPRAAAWHRGAGRRPRGAGGRRRRSRQADRVPAGVAQG